jgi:hypothetical protein
MTTYYWCVFRGKNKFGRLSPRNIWYRESVADIFFQIEMLLPFSII